MFTEIAALRDTVKPDIILFSKCRELPTWVVDAYEGVARVLWYMDPVNGNYVPNLVALMKRCEHVYCNIWEAVEKARSDGVDAELLQEGFDMMVDRPFPLEEDKGVTFIGCPRGERKTYCQAVGAEVIQGVYREEHAKAVCRSKINLNFTQGGSSDRSYKVLAAGGFLLTQPWPHMTDDFVLGRDLDTFVSVNDLKRQIDRYLGNPSLRHEIAWRGHRTVQKFTRDAWAQRILSDVG